MLCVLLLCCGATATATPAPAGRLELSDALADLHIERGPDGGAVFVLPGGERLTGEELAATLEQMQAGRNARPWWQQVLNITSPLGVLWVALGLLGQVLFTGRMLVQWLASERAKRSMVPEAFWWMSFLGATMLLAYFVWRRDIVGVLGQATGWGIYLRNLWLIRVTHRKPDVA